jgi:hypothetical protein
VTRGVPPGQLPTLWGRETPPREETSPAHGSRRPVALPTGGATALTAAVGRQEARGGRVVDCHPAGPACERLGCANTAAPEAIGTTPRGVQDPLAESASHIAERSFLSSLALSSSSFKAALPSHFFFAKYEYTLRPTTHAKKRIPTQKGASIRATACPFLPSSRLRPEPGPREREPRPPG